jgi:ferredoxin
MVGTLVLDLGAVDKILNRAEASTKESLLGRIFNWYKNSDSSQIMGFKLRDVSIGDPTGIYIVPSDTSEPPEKQVVEGQATAARVLNYLGRGVLRARANAIAIDRQLCRGCGDCTAVCPYIEMKIGDSGTAYAAIDPILCLGCGACIASCPTGAITQPAQNDLGIISTLESLLDKPGRVGAAT